MKTTLQSIPGYIINEYMLVLNPHQDLQQKIMQLKKDFAETYRLPAAAYGKPHIALARFTQYSMMEERILNRLKTVAMGFPPFRVELRNFGSFPSHSVFINVVTKEPVRELVKEIKTAQQLMKLNADNKPHFIDEPSIN